MESKQEIIKKARQDAQDANRHATAATIIAQDAAKIVADAYREPDNVDITSAETQLAISARAAKGATKAAMIAAKCVDDDDPAGAMFNRDVAASKRREAVTAAKAAAGFVDVTLFERRPDDIADKAAAVNLARADKARAERAGDLARAAILQAQNAAQAAADAADAADAGDAVRAVDAATRASIAARLGDIAAGESFADEMAYKAAGAARMGYDAEQSQAIDAKKRAAESAEYAAESAEHAGAIAGRFAFLAETTEKAAQAAQAAAQDDETPAGDDRAGLDPNVAQAADWPIPELVDGHWMFYIPADALVDGKGYRPSIVIEGVAGHYPNGGGDTEPWYWGNDFDQAKSIARERNDRAGLTPDDETRILASSMIAGRPAGTTIELSKIQAEILRHRLEAPDSIAEALSDDFDADDVDIIAGYIMGGLTAAGVDLTIAERYNPDITAAVLVDCVDGSTVYAAAVAGSGRERRRIGRAGDDLAGKVGEYAGFDILFPWY